MKAKQILLSSNIGSFVINKIIIFPSTTIRALHILNISAYHEENQSSLSSVATLR
jgi:hypothetical protein